MVNNSTSHANLSAIAFFHIRITKENVWQPSLYQHFIYIHYIPSDGWMLIQNITAN